MAAARSPCGGFKTRVLHFKVKNTPLKDKTRKEKVKKVLGFLSVEEGKIFIKKSSLGASLKSSKVLKSTFYGTSFLGLKFSILGFFGGKIFVFKQSDDSR